MDEFTESSTDIGTLSSITFPVFQHKGIVLNVEDFRGGIEFMNSVISKNMIYVPEIYITRYATATEYDLEKFYSSTTSEYSFAYCDTSSGVNRYLLTHGYDAEYDIELLFDTFERLGVIYISRNNGPMIFRNTSFYDNIGTFGGAITISSPDYKGSNEFGRPFVVIKNCIFERNMAYFSGNAVYLRMTKLSTNLRESCTNLFI